MPLWTGIGRPDPTWWSQTRFEPDPTRSSQTLAKPGQRRRSSSSPLSLPPSPLSLAAVTSLTASPPLSVATRSCYPRRAPRRHPRLHPRRRSRRAITWMREDGFAGATEAAPPEHRFTIEGGESVMGS